MNRRGFCLTAAATVVFPGLAMADADTQVVFSGQLHGMPLRIRVNRRNGRWRVVWRHGTDAPRTLTIRAVRGDPRTLGVALETGQQGLITVAGHTHLFALNANGDRWRLRVEGDNGTEVITQAQSASGMAADLGAFALAVAVAVVEFVVETAVDAQNAVVEVAGDAIEAVVAEEEDEGGDTISGSGAGK